MYGESPPDQAREFLRPSSSDTEVQRSLDFTQRIEKKLARYNASENVFKRWLFEIICWIISASCMVAIVLIYVHIKDDSISSKGWFLTGTNVLGKVSSAALIVPTSEALGQLKWNWFHASKAMWDFEIFDKASRGPWGALMLLFRTKGRSLAALGALLILLMLAIDTFFQQVVDLPVRWTLQDIGVLPKTTHFEANLGRVYREGADMNVADKDMSLVVEKFSFGNGTQPVLFGNGTRPDIPLSCPTSKCTWPVYETFGVCSQCSDISEHLVFACLDNRVDWTANLTGGFQVEAGYRNATMCGYFLNATSGNPILMSGYLVSSSGSTQGEALVMRTLPLTTTLDWLPLYGNGSINYKHLRNTVADVLVVSAANGSAANVYRNHTPVAQECVLTWCIKTIRSSYDWGNYEEEVIETFTNTTEGPFPWISIPFQTDFQNGTDNYYLQDINIDAGTTSDGRVISGYGTSNSTALAIVQGFMDVFPAYTTTVNSSEPPMMRFKAWSQGPAWNRVLDFNPWLAPNNVSRHMERLATAMTNVIRSSSSKEMLQGNAWEKETFISVKWQWLAFPLSLLFLSLIFLVATIHKTSKDAVTGVWKTSTMPTLIYSLPKETQSQFTTSSTWRSAQETKKTRIRLLPDIGWRVSGHSLSSTSPRLPPQTSTAPRGWM